MLTCSSMYLKKTKGVDAWRVLGQARRSGGRRRRSRGRREKTEPCAELKEKGNALMHTLIIWSELKFLCHVALVVFLTFIVFPFSNFAIVTKKMFAIIHGIELYMYT